MFINNHRFMPRKKLDINKIRLDEIGVIELKRCLKPWELAVLLNYLNATTETDILLFNMLIDCEREELYEYCSVIRDEINRRN